MLIAVHSRLFPSVDVLAIHFVQQRPLQERLLGFFDFQIRTGHVRRIDEWRVVAEPLLESRLAELYTLVEPEGTKLKR